MNEITREYLESLQSFKTEGEYRDSPSINYSTLKDLPDGPQCLTGGRKDISGDAIIIGSYVDAWFTDHDKLRDLYEMGKPIIKLPLAEETLCQSFIKDANYAPTMDECVHRVRELELWNSIKDDKKIPPRITAPFFEKLRDESEKTDKIRLTVDQLSKANYSIENIMHNDEATKLISEGDNEIIVNQFKWEFDLPLDSGRTRTFRAMYDKLKFNLDTKKITGIDIKTGAKMSHTFGDSFFDYRYDIQSIVYLFGLVALRHKYFQDWTEVIPGDFKFLYSPKIPNQMPAIVALDSTFIDNNAKMFSHKGKSVPSAWALMNDADWYIHNQEFINHRILSETNGVVTISKLL